MFESWPLATPRTRRRGEDPEGGHPYKSDDFSELIRHRYLKQETKDYVPRCWPR